MWLQARQQEKTLRTAMVDSRKRAERRRKFYDAIKRDPMEFMQVHGRKCKIHMDPVIAKAADSSLTFWQGDASIQIDRFDARAHLDVIPGDGKAVRREASPDAPTDDESTREGRHVAYESFRLLVVNEFEKLGEDKALRRIELEERHGGVAPSSLAKEERLKKKKMDGKKAAIAFTYDDSTAATAAAAAPEEDDDDSDEEEEVVLVDRTLDVTRMRPEQCRELNKMSHKFGMIGEDFVKNMWDDKDKSDSLADMKRDEIIKSKLSGRKSRRERAVLKQQKLVSKGQTWELNTSLRQHRVWSPELKYQRSSSSSPEPAAGLAPQEGALTYITSFSVAAEGKEEGEEDKDVVQGPAPPPPEFKKLIELRKAASPSPELRSAWEDRRRRSRSRESQSRRRRSHRKRRSQSRDSRRRRSRSRERRRSRSDSRRRRRRRSSSESSRSPSRERSQASSAAKKKSEPSNSKIRNITEQGSPVVPVKRRRSPSPPKSRRRRDSSSSPVESELEIKSDMSESEVERREVENRKRRVRRAKKKFKSGGGAAASSNARRSSSGSDGGSIGSADVRNKKALSVRERLALSTQKALRRTQAADRLETEARRRQAERDQIEREEEIRERSIQQRVREREERERSRRRRSRSDSRDRSRSSTADLP